MVTAAKAGKPKATNKGLQTAAGVPKPEAPSRKLPNSQTIIIAWMRLSGEIANSPRRIVAIAPDSRKIFSSKIAPKMM